MTVLIAIPSALESDLETKACPPLTDIHLKKGVDNKKASE